MSSYKECPRCKTPALLATEICQNCGRVYKTKFEEPEAKTQMFTPPSEPLLRPPHPHYTQPQEYRPPQQYPQPLQRQYPLPPKYIQYVPGTFNVAPSILLTLLLLGLGQCSNGQSAKGMTLLLVGVVGGLATAGILGLVIWVIAFIDAILIANRLHRGEAVGPWQFF